MTLSRACGAAAIAAMLCAGAARAAQATYASPQDAAAALVAAVQSGDRGRILAVLGPDGAPLVESGDPVQDAQARRGFAADYAANHALVSIGHGRTQLVIGANHWPLPIPIVQDGKRWRFDTAAGAQEVLDRRVGRNELLTIRTLLAIAEAEQDYFERVKAGSGTGVYAQRVLSRDGQKDGLYWPAGPGDAPSPLGPLVDQARDEGYPDEVSPGGKKVAYHGYFFHVLTAQGADAEGGARSYLSGSDMTGGFAFVAWPAQYGNSGVMTFIMGPDGVVYQKDLGDDTDKIATAMTAFDPDAGWARVAVTD